MRCNEIGVNVSRQGFVDFLNGVKGGQFFIVKGYVNEQGEKADHILRFGIRYGQLKERDVRTLNAVLAGQRDFHLSLTHGSWVPTARLMDGTLLLAPDQIAALPERRRSELINAKITAKVPLSGAELTGATVTVELNGTIDPMDTLVFGNRKAADRSQATVHYHVPSIHPLAVAAIGAPDLEGTVLQGLVNPKQRPAVYEGEAKSCYSKVDQPNRWYIRDVLRVHKTVRVLGNYKFEASLPVNAVKAAVRSQVLLTGKYREFILTDGQFESITIEGQAVLCDGIDEEFYFALPEHVQEAVGAEAG